MDLMGYLETIRGYVIENFLFGDDSGLEVDTSFLESGIVDSTGILELIQFIEETYDIRVEDEELVPENLDSLKNIVQFLERKLTNGTVMKESIG
jgi:acyl carrier protein